MVIDDKRDKGRKIVTAKTGRIFSNEADRTITIFLKDGSIHEIIDGKYSLTDYATNSIVMEADELYESSDKPRRRRSRELTWSELQSEKRKAIKAVEEYVPPAESDDAKGPDITLTPVNVEPPPDKRRSTSMGEFR